ncbi:winged helix-turn-helix domain-containing tetratricopeptide repeat protein [Sedimenticola hydrogenitrophicus]|uniref:winged helix-turn-helix domain-containing tetratricopeptide repeat protein n=1 Tax=Sedimenticola hydrogenitrophicus TaxID=2967975 RepID=UPI0023AFE9AC|nr:winged helix-turn-helix domain-containing protein [Sedimenticola hydrogenitrophicus]
MRYRFNVFILDTDRFELSKSGERLRCEPQVIELLKLLVENRDRVVSKDEIYETVWRGRIVTEASLSSRIKSLRQLLGDDARNQRFIRTVHKKGFQFIATVDDEPETAVETVAEAPAKPLKASDNTHRPAVAVLPFENLSGAPDQEYFSDGITSDIITHLSKHRWIDVTARNTSFGYKNRAIDVRQLGEELRVNYVVEGTVQRAGNRIRVSAHLVDAGTGHYLWADRYDGEVEDIFSLQDQITEKIVARIEPEIGYAERNRVVRSRPANLQALDCYYLGIYHFFKFTGADNLEAQRLLKLSCEKDEQFGEACAWWAYAVIMGMVYWDTPPTQQLMDAALDACDTALSLDGQNASFHALKARILLARCEYHAALMENAIAIQLNPTLAAAHCGMGDSLAYEGRYDESMACFEKSIELSPNDPQLWAFYTYGALSLLFKHDYERALEWLDKAATIPNCQYWTTAHKAVALVYLDRLGAAKRNVKSLLKNNPGFCLDFAREKLFYLKMPEQIEMYIDGLEKAGVPHSI